MELKTSKKLVKEEKMTMILLNNIFVCKPLREWVLFFKECNIAFKKEIMDMKKIYFI